MLFQLPQRAWSQVHAVQGSRGWTLPETAVFLLLEGYVLPSRRSEGRFATCIWPISTELTISNTLASWNLGPNYAWAREQAVPALYYILIQRTWLISYVKIRHSPECGTVIHSLQEKCSCVQTKHKITWILNISRNLDFFLVLAMVNS